MKRDDMFKREASYYYSCTIHTTDTNTSGARRRRQVYATPCAAISTNCSSGICPEYVFHSLLCSSAITVCSVVKTSSAVSRLQPPRERNGRPCIMVFAFVPCTSQNQIKINCLLACLLALPCRNLHRVVSKGVCGERAVVCVNFQCA